MVSTLHHRRFTRIKGKENIRDAVERIPATMIRKIEAVAEARREVGRVRAEALTRMKGGLRALYRTLELPGANPLKDAHAALDTAVLNAWFQRQKGSPRPSPGIKPTSRTRRVIAKLLGKA
jgi:hypothetical protein